MLPKKDIWAEGATYAKALRHTGARGFRPLDLAEATGASGQTD